MGEKEQRQGLETTLFQLLELKDQGSDPLILLSLVNLMGLINLIGHRLGIRGEEKNSLESGAGRESANGTPSRDSAEEMSPQLVGLLGNLLGPPGPSRASGGGKPGQEEAKG